MKLICDECGGEMIDVVIFGNGNFGIIAGRCSKCYRKGFAVIETTELAVVD